MVETSKRIKRQLRELARAAHEEELRRALIPMAEAFKRWERGELGSGGLSDAVHHFHEGPARTLFARYNDSQLQLAVAYAITAGILDRQNISPELLDHLAGALEVWQYEQAVSRRRGSTSR